MLIRKEDKESLDSQAYGLRMTVNAVINPLKKKVTFPSYSLNRHSQPKGLGIQQYSRKRLDSQAYGLRMTVEVVIAALAESKM